jgi:DNA-binding GntR family transcriptional regulator
MTGARVPPARVSAVDELAVVLRARILDGDLRAGARLPEAELCSTYLIARHTARAALRALAAEGLVAIEPHRGARVASLDPEAVQGLYELRTALEVEAVRMALARGDGRLPDPVHAAVRRLRAACARPRPAWSAVVDAHEGVHAALVEASGSRRLAATHAALAGETRLFLVQLRPAWTVERMADDHARLVDDLEARGADALREHLRASADAVLAEAERDPSA